MDLVVNLLVNVIKITQCLATILTAFACVNRDGLGTSARCVCCNCVRDRIVWYMSVGFSLLDATFHCCG